MAESEAALKRIKARPSLSAMSKTRREGKRQKKQFFFEKKNQKTFAMPC